jgi:hypothetical protein
MDSRVGHIDMSVRSVLTDCDSYLRNLRNLWIRLLSFAVRLQYFPRQRVYSSGWMSR